MGDTPDYLLKPLILKRCSGKRPSFQEVENTVANTPFDSKITLVAKFVEAVGVVADTAAKTHDAATINSAQEKAFEIGAQLFSQGAEVNFILAQAVQAGRERGRSIF